MWRRSAPSTSSGVPSAAWLRAICGADAFSPSPPGRGVGERVRFEDGVQDRCILAPPLGKGTAMRTLATCALALALTACASTAQLAPATITTFQGDQADIAEQVFRSLLGSNASTDLDNRKPVTLCFEKETDPDAAFLARFASYGKRVHPCSAGH